MEQVLIFQSVLEYFGKRHKSGIMVFPTDIYTFVSLTTSGTHFGFGDVRAKEWFEFLIFWVLFLYIDKMMRKQRWRVELLPKLPSFDAKH